MKPITEGISGTKLNCAWRRCNLTFSPTVTSYVSKLIDIPAHHLSYYLREEQNQSFNDYRNERRVHHAKNLIREGTAKELTLEAIGRLLGYSTRNTFFTVFKKAAGVCPVLLLPNSPNKVFLSKLCTVFQKRYNYTIFVIFPY